MALLWAAPRRSQRREVRFHRAMRFTRGSAAFRWSSSRLQVQIKLARRRCIPQAELTDVGLRLLDALRREVILAVHAELEVARLVDLEELGGVELKLLMRVDILVEHRAADLQVLGAELERREGRHSARRVAEGNERSLPVDMTQSVGSSNPSVKCMPSQDVKVRVEGV